MKRALQLMVNTVAIATLADRFFTSISRDLKREVLDELEARKDKLENEIFDLTNLQLATNLNAGQTQMSQDEVKKRFKDVIEKEFELDLLRAEIKSKTDTYNKYFVEDVKEVKGE